MQCFKNLSPISTKSYRLEPYFKKLVFEWCIVGAFQEGRGVDFTDCLIRSQASGGSTID